MSKFYIFSETSKCFGFKHRFTSLLIVCMLVAFAGMGQVANYQFSQSTGNTYTAVTGAPNAIGGGWDDDGPVTLNIGFTFTFNGTGYTQVSVNANGYITFGGASANNSYTPISSGTAYAGAISALGRDLEDAASGNQIKYRLQGASPNQVFLVQWTNAARYPRGTTNSSFNFQIRLYQTTNVVEILYGTCTNSYTTDLPVEVGLRGASNADFSNRVGTSTTPWTASDPGQANNATMSTVFNNPGLIVPTSGLSLKWTPACASIPLKTNITMGTLNITTAVINWTALSPAPAAGYDWKVTNTNANPGSEAVAVTSGTTAATTATATGLTGSTDYSVYVRSRCSGSSFGSWQGPVNFTTPSAGCVTPSNQPTAASLLTVVNSTTINGSFTPAAGPITPTNYLVVRTTSFPGPTPVNGTSYTIGTAAFGPGTNIVSTSASTTFSEATLTSNTHYYYYVYSFRSACGGAPYYYDTNPLWGEAITCPAAPGIPTASSISSSAFTVDWTASPVGGGAATINYTVEVSTNAAFSAPIAGSPFNAGTSITYPVSGLSPNTQYWYRVKANNGCSSSYSSSGPLTTPCAAIVTFPFTESFDDASTSRACWAIGEDVAGSLVHWVYTSGDGTHGVNLAQGGPGGKFASLDVFSATVAKNRYNLTSPIFTLSGVAKQLKYYYYLGANGYTLSPVPMTIQVSVNGGAFANLYQHTSANSLFATGSAYGTNWHLNTIDLTPYAGQNVQFRFASNSNFGSNFCNQEIDQVTVENIPTCAFPLTTSSSAVVITTATISWSAVAGAGLGYEYFVSTSPSDPSDLATATGSTGPGITTANLTGLNPSTTYYFWVRSVCSSIDKSSWTTSNNFTTLYCIPTYTNGTVNNDYITNITFAGINNSTFGAASPFYTFYPAPPAVIYQTVNSNFTITVNAAHDDYVGMWIDLNDDGIFSTAERLINNILTVGNTYSQVINLPAVPATVGTHRMRVRISRATTTNFDPCSSYVRGETEDYNVTVLALTPCSGLPAASTTLSSVNPTCPATNFTLSLGTSYVSFSGISYQWQSANDAAFTVALTNLGTASTQVTTIAAAKYFRCKITCANGGGITYSATLLEGIGPCYCIPTINNQGFTYINKVNFIGTLNDISNNNTGFGAPAGYQDWTGLTNKASQAQGEGINIYLENNAHAGINAWVDWNKDGLFDNTTELVYTTNGVVTLSTTFGFVVPGAALGDYRLRIRVDNYYDYPGDPSNFNSCQNLRNGEAEDYIFTVVPSCAALITSVTDGENCGTGPVTLTVAGSPGVTQYRWYTAPTGGVSVNTPTPTYTTPPLSATTTYYVTAYNGSCESLVRTAIIAKISPVPVIGFTPVVPVVCGEGAVLPLTAAGNTEQAILIDQKFESGLAPFTVNNLNMNPAGYAALAQWQSQTSTFVPGYTTVWHPAIASAFGTNKFAFATSDNASTVRVNTALESPSVNSSTFTNLFLDFDVYYSHYLVDDNITILDEFNIDVSVNGGGAWTTFTTYTGDLGYGGKFAHISLDLSAYINVATLKIRFRYNAAWVDGVAIDNVKLYGTRPLTTSFSWAPIGNGDSFTNPAGTIPYTGGSVANLYIKPTVAELTAGTDLVFTATAVLSNGCSVATPVTVKMGPSQWIGVVAGGDWNNVNNWCSKTIPTATTIVQIPAGTPNNPVISAGAFAAKITIDAGASLTINSGGSISVKGNFDNQGTLTNNGTISLNGTTLQTFPGPGTVSAMSVLEINNNSGVTLNKSIPIEKELRPTAGILSLGNNDITIRSQGANTAAVSALGSTADFTYGTGKFIVERYISTGPAPQHGKSWQLLAAPTVGQTIKASWMEGSLTPNDNRNPGYGTQIVGTTGTAGGFDMAATLPGMKFYLPATNTWQEVGNPGTTQINNSQGYFIFVRGNRSATAVNSPPSSTILRTTGTIQTGPITSPVAPAGLFQSVANPYPSAIDFSTLTKNGGVDPNFYVFDPTLKGSKNAGGYQTITQSTGYLATPGNVGNAVPGVYFYNTTSDYRAIQSGNAFLIRATGSNGSLGFKESDKVNPVASTLVNRPGDNSSIDAISMLSTNLLTVSAGVPVLIDGNRVVFNNIYANAVDGNDARKILNSAENFGLMRDGVQLAVEAKKQAHNNDTIYYNLGAVEAGSYSFMFVPANLNMDGMTAILIDKYLNTSVPVSLLDTSYTSFDINTDAGSKAADRFMLVFKSTVVVPVSFINISAYPDRDKGTKIRWEVNNELNIADYSVERSADGRSFNAIIKTAAANKSIYEETDLKPLNADNFYRIKAAEFSGQVLYSPVVKTRLSSELNTGIIIYPNPISGRKIQIQFNNQPNGIYNLQMTDKSGQVVYKGIANINSGKFVFSITLNSSVVSGTYQMKITAVDGKINTQQIIVP